MMVDFFVINVLVQGLNLGKHIRRRLIAPYKLTQFEMNEAYSCLTLTLTLTLP